MLGLLRVLASHKKCLTVTKRQCMINPTRVINEPCIRTFGQFLPLTQKTNQIAAEVASECACVP